MKKKIFNILTVMVTLLCCLSSCEKQEIVFDHEKPQFELKENAILLEVIMPQGTAKDDAIYIVGDFNGGEEVALDNIEWQLEKASSSDVKWGIYLDPTLFINGKTLADGFYFVSKKQGVERSVLNEGVTHNLSAQIGTRSNLTVQRWKAYFEAPEEIKHDGYVIYIEDNTTWSTFNIYAWGDGMPELFGTWPGIQATGTEVKNGITYKYFDTGESNKGLQYNLIFHNGDGKQFDGPAYTIDKDIYIKITDTGWEEVGEAIVHDGYAIFIEDNTGWDAMTMYAWGDGMPDLFGGWPGVESTGEVVIKGVKYKYFDTGKANEGLEYNLILNNKDKGKQFDLAHVKLDRHYYFQCSEKGGVEVDPNNPESPVDPEPPVDPVPPVDPAPTSEYKIYIEDNSGWDALTIYAWGDGIPELFGGWPGVKPSGTETVDGISYKYFTCSGAGETYNLIFNSNGDEFKFDGPSIIVNKDYYISITATGFTIK